MLRYNYVLTFGLIAALLCTSCKEQSNPVDASNQSGYNTADVVDIDNTDISLTATAVTSDGWTVFALLSSCQVVVYDLKGGGRDTIVLSGAHGTVTWDGALALDTSNNLLMVMDKTSNVASVWNWKTKSRIVETVGVGRAFISPDGEWLLVQVQNEPTIRKINIYAKSEETLSTPLTMTSADLMLGVDWERQGVVVYSSYPLVTNVQSFDGTTVLNTITWPADITSGTFACSRDGDWATLCFGGKNNEPVGMVSFDLRTGQQLGKLGADEAGVYQTNLQLLGDRRAYISAQRTSGSLLEPAIHDVASGAALQTLTLSPDAERTARAWGVSQHDRYITAFLFKAPAATGVLRMWRVR